MERNAFISKIRDLQNQEKRSMEARIIQFCTPKELDGISLSFSDMLTFDQFMGY